MELDGKRRLVTSMDGVVRVERGVRHAYWHAYRDLKTDTYTAAKSVNGAEDKEDLKLTLEVDRKQIVRSELAKDLVTIESTDPSDGDKEVFFR